MKTLLATILSAACAHAFAAGYDVRTTSPTGAVTAQCAQSASVSGTTYTFAGVTSGACTTAPPPPSACPAGRYTQGTITGDYGATQRLGDLTQARTLYSYTPPLADFPFENRHGQSVLSLPRNGYIAALFHVPTNIGPTMHGAIIHASTMPGPPLDARISRVCGDFSPDVQCGKSNARAGETLVAWREAGINAPSYCLLMPGADYYVNIRLHDPHVVDAQACNTASCLITTSGQYTP